MSAKTIRTRTPKGAHTELELVVRVRVHASDVAHLQALVDACASTRDGACWPPIHSLDDLLSLLVADLALAARRPGSWEGANMLAVLEAHGYVHD